MYKKQKFILPIYPQYHTSLLPDSKLNNENAENFLCKDPHKYALQKVYISWALERNVHPGDLILFYRIGEQNKKKYTSVVTTLGVIDEIITGFKDKKDYLQHCQNRSVFIDEELEKFWNGHSKNLMIVKFIYIKTLGTKLTLKYLWDNSIVNAPSGPRPFLKLTDKQFNDIIKDSQTVISFN
jgi:hypothetical protein